MICTNYIDIARFILCKIIHDILSHIMNRSITWQRNSWNRVVVCKIKQSYSHSPSTVFKNILSIRWTSLIDVNLWRWISYFCFWLNCSWGSDILWSECVDSFATMVIKFQSVAMCQSCCLLKCNSTTALPTVSAPIFDSHYALRKIAFVHIEIEAVHSYKLDESNVISLLIRISQMVSEHKASSFACMSMKIYKHFKAFVIIWLLCNCSSSSPYSWLLFLVWVQI